MQTECNKKITLPIPIANTLIPIDRAMLASFIVKRCASFRLEGILGTPSVMIIAEFGTPYRSPFWKKV